MKHSFFSYTVLRPWLWRWHRRAGLAAALIIVLVTATGIFLNHTSGLSLAKRYIEQPWLLSFYGIPEPKIVSIQLAGAIISGVDEGSLFFDDKPLAACDSALVGAVTVDVGFIAGCAEALLWFDDRGELLEKINATYGLPAPVTQLGTCGKQICLQAANSVHFVNLEQLSFEPTRWDSPAWSRKIELPESLRQPIFEAVGRRSLNWERVMLDLHTGRLFGSLGVWVVDIAAVLLLFLALSGSALWFQRLFSKRATRD